MKISLRNQKISLLKMILSIGLMVFAFHSTSEGRICSVPSPTSNTPEECKACDFLDICQKSWCQDLDKKCKEFCPDSKCAKGGESTPPESKSAAPSSENVKIKIKVEVEEKVKKCAKTQLPRKGILGDCGKNCQNTIVCEKPECKNLLDKCKELCPKSKCAKGGESKPFGK